jgi:ABC-type Co2+ transport system permease subunit
VAGSETWAGWIRLGAILMMIIGFIDFFQGLIAIIRGGYYTLTPNQIILVDTRTWGWVMLFWGIIVIAAGWGLTLGASWARWFTIVVASLNIIVQLGFLGSSNHTLWSLTGVALSAVVLYAVTVRWEEASETIRRMAESRM